MTATEVIIPHDLRPSDGRFGAGPSKVPSAAMNALHAAAPTLMGTSHRRPPVRSLVARLRGGLSALFSLPDDYEVVVGNGGSTAFWDALAFGLVERRSLHYVFGEFSAKCAAAIAAAPHLQDPVVVESEPGTHPEWVEVPADVDAVSLTHNETSTGVAMPVRRDGDALVMVDATSAAGGIEVEPQDFDAYYFAPQKCFASDGGLWIALLSPAAQERIEAIAGSGRYVPPSLDLGLALASARKDQTYNTPSIATLFLMVEQIEWMVTSGGLAWTARRCAESAGLVYSWAQDHPHALPFVGDPARRSPTVATIDFTGVDAKVVAATLRANGIVDTEPYRKLGRNQLRIALYPAIEPSDVAQLTRCIDYVIENVAR